MNSFWKTNIYRGGDQEIPVTHFYTKTKKSIISEIDSLIKNGMGIELNKSNRTMIRGLCRSKHFCVDDEYTLLITRIDLID